MKYFFICLFLLCIPVYSQAAIVINEVAWMGTTVSANDEWIELYNDGTQGVNVDGWVLSDGNGLEITLTGNVASGQYAVLERTDDASAPGTAFLIYTGALSNSGSILSLNRADGSLEDRVSGGEDWEYIGGDNITKETAQYTSAGWITSTPTPGETNVATIEQDDPEEEENTVEEEVTLKVSQISLHHEPRTLQTKMTGPSRVYEMQKNTFEIQSSGLSDGIINSLEHRWNFGDLHTAAGKEVNHRFEYPGEYVVTVHSFYKQYEAYTRKQVVVLPVTFSLTQNSQGDIQLHNDARYEIDISGYMLMGSKSVLFPEHTILLPNGTITIPKKKIADGLHTKATLYDQTHLMLATLNGSKVTREAVVYTAPILTPSVQVAVSKQEASPDTTFNFASDDVQEREKVTPEAARDSVQGAMVVQATPDIPRSMIPYMLLIGVIGLGVLGIVASKIT